MFFQDLLNMLLKHSEKHKVNPRDVFFELGKRNAVAGQEDLILDVVKNLKKDKQNFIY